MVEAGLFAIVGVFASIFTFGGFRSVNKYPKGILHILALALFMIMSVWNLSGEQVAATETTLTFNETNDQIFNETTTSVVVPEGESTHWLGYVWMGLASLNLVLFVKDVWNAS